MNLPQILNLREVVYKGYIQYPIYLMPSFLVLFAYKI